MDTPSSPLFICPLFAGTLLASNIVTVTHVAPPHPESRLRCVPAQPQPRRAVDWCRLAHKSRELKRVVEGGSMWELEQQSSLAPAIRALKAA